MEKVIESIPVSIARSATFTFGDKDRILGVTGYPGSAMLHIERAGDGETYRHREVIVFPAEDPIPYAWQFVALLDWAAGAWVIYEVIA